MAVKTETKKAQKIREIAERKAKIEAEKLAERNIIFATPLAKAVEPLKIVSVARAELKAKEWAKNKLAELEAAGWDLNKIAPVGNSWAMGRDEYMSVQARRNSFERVTSYKPEGYNDQSWRDMSLPRIVKKCQAGIDRHIEWSRETAATQYEQFVYKMVRKVGEHNAARLETRAGVWGESFLYITMPDSSIQRWKTQIIVNHSVYGKPFNQWPSRIVK